MEVNGYKSTNYINSADKNSAVKKKGSNLDMSDFLNLLVAQMTNQDSMNPMENTEFIAQLAQFSSLQAMSTLTEITAQSQATSLVGKNVVMANYNNKGELEIKEGKVEKVTIYSGKTRLFVGGIDYDILNLMEIKADAKPTTPTDPPPTP